ncbi:hypothetical protein M5689_004546 [Euphorbia peplus]|nr:hypothetical protein M5689_004546 [Euphorbia peplus]
MVFFCSSLGEETDDYGDGESVVQSIFQTSQQKPTLPENKPGPPCYVQVFHQNNYWGLFLAIPWGLSLLDHLMTSLVRVLRWLI